MRTEPTATGDGTTGIKAGPIASFAGNPVAANLLMAVIAIVGLLAGSRLVLRDVPVADWNRIRITVESPGASAREVEEEIVRRMEEAVLGISGVERVVGTAVADLATVIVEYSSLSDGDAVLQDVENAVDNIDNFPPPIASEPEIEIVLGEVTALTLAVSSPYLDQDALQRAAEDIRDQLMQLPGISDVTLRGARDREVSIEMDEEQLRRYRLSFATIAARVRGSSLNLSFGELDTQSGQVALHTVSKRQTGAQFADIPLVTRADGTIIRLGDVAEIRDAFAPSDQVALTVNGAPAVLVTVGVAQWQSITDVAEQVREWLAGFTAPPEVTVSIWEDAADTAVTRISIILRSVAVGMALVFACLILVLDLRNALWVALGIPLAFVGSLMLLAALDLTISNLTIAMFFILVGLVVDDALIVAENIDAERKANPRRPLAAAVRGARAVFAPVTVGAITTVLAFVPLLFVVGPFQPMAVFPYVVAGVMAVSLIEAFLILPAHLSHSGNWTLSPLRDVQGYVSGLLVRLRERTVAPLVSWAVRHVWTTFAAAGLFVLVALALLATGMVPFVAFSGNSSARTNIRADLYLPVGTPFATTLATADRVADAAAALDDAFGGTTVRGVSVFVGNLFSAPVDEDETHASHLASVMLHVADRAGRTASVFDVGEAWAQRIGRVPLLKRFDVSAREESTGTVNYSLAHEDEAMLQNATERLTSFMASIEGVSGVWDSLAPGKRHIDIGVTPAGQAAGLTPAAIGRQLRANYHGLEIQELQRGPDEVKVMLRYPIERRRSLQELSARAHSPSGGFRGRRDAPEYCRHPGRAPRAGRADAHRRRACRTGERPSRPLRGEPQTGAAADRGTASARDAGRVPRASVRGGWGRADGARTVRHVGRDGTGGNVGAVRAHRGVPAQLLETVRRRGRVSARLRRRRDRPLGSGLGLWRNLVVRRDRGLRRRRERRAGAVGPLQHDTAREQRTAGDRGCGSGHKQPIPRRVPDQRHHPGRPLSPALRAQRPADLPGAVRGQHGRRPDPVRRVHAVHSPRARDGGGGPQVAPSTGVAGRWWFMAPARNGEAAGGPDARCPVMSVVSYIISSAEPRNSSLVERTENPG